MLKMQKKAERGEKSKKCTFNARVGKGKDWAVGLGVENVYGGCD